MRKWPQYLPAMQAGLIKKPMTIEDIAGMSDYTALKSRGSYKKNENV